MATHTLSTTLRRRLEAIDRDQPARRLQCIVSLQEDGTAESVSAAGMAVDQHIHTPPILLGTMTAKQALAVARLNGVAKVELDEGGVHALKD